MFDAGRTRRRLKEALKLLTADRELLLRGDVGGLARFNTRRARLMEELPTLAEHDLAENEGLVHEIRTLARRNSRLLEAFLAGAKAAGERVKALVAAQEALGAYRRDGSRILAPALDRTTSRRL